MLSRHWSSFLKQRLEGAEYQRAMAAARETLGAEHGRPGDSDPDITWIVKLPGQRQSMSFKPKHQFTGRSRSVPLDLRADLNAEDDEGLNWTLLENAEHPDRVQPGAVLSAGSPGFWSWVRIVRVDDDGQVHFQQLSNSEARSQGKNDC